MAAKTKKPTKPTGGAPILRGDEVFIHLKALGELGANGKVVMSIGYGGRISAKKDHPLALVRWLLRELKPHCRYSTKKAAAADLKELKADVNDLVAS